MDWIDHILYTYSRKHLAGMVMDGIFFEVTPTLARKLRSCPRCTVLGEGYEYCGVPFKPKQEGE